MSGCRNIIRRKTLGLATYEPRNPTNLDANRRYVGDDEISVPHDLIAVTCNYPGCNHELWIWDFPICRQCIEKLEKEYPILEKEGAL